MIKPVSFVFDTARMQQFRSAKLSSRDRDKLVKTFFNFITALSVCLSVCLSVYLSVRLSNARVHCDKTEERSVQIFISYKSFLPEILGQPAPVRAKSPILTPIFARSASAVTPRDALSNELKMGIVRCS